MCFSSTCARLATSIWHDHQPDSPAREIVVSLQGTAVYWHAEPLARGGKVRRLHLLQPCWCPPSCNRYSNRTSAVREAVVRLVQRIEPTGSSRLDQVLNLARGATSAVFSPRGDLLAWTGPGSPGNRSSRSPRRQSNRDESLRGLPRDGRGNRSPQRPGRTTPQSPEAVAPLVWERPGVRTGVGGQECSRSVSLNSGRRNPRAGEHRECSGNRPRRNRR